MTDLYFSLPDDLEEAIHLFADGELPLDAHADLFARLSVSMAARELLDSLLAFRRMSRMESLAAPPSLDLALMARLKEVQRSQQKRRDRAPHPGVWGRSVQMSVRALTVGAMLLLAVGSLVPMRTPAEPAPIVRLAPPPTSNGVAMSASYVITDGVTVEADRE